MNSQVSTIEPEALDYMPAATLLRLVAAQQNATKNLKAFRETVTGCADLFRQLESLDIDMQFCADSYYIALRFSGDGEKLKTVWGILRRAGFNTRQRPEKGDTGFNAFWSREGFSELFMCFSSSLCRRVKVGTKLVEQDVFETQCGELPEIEAPTTDLTVVDDVPF